MRLRLLCIGFVIGGSMGVALFVLATPFFAKTFETSFGKVVIYNEFVHQLSNGEIRYVHIFPESLIVFRTDGNTYAMQRASSDLYLFVRLRMAHVDYGTNVPETFSYEEKEFLFQLLPVLVFSALLVWMIRKKSP